MKMLGTLQAGLKVASMPDLVEYGDYTSGFQDLFLGMVGRPGSWSTRGGCAWFFG
jgi:hypothetical protein